MRILVLKDEGDGAARLLERKDVYEVQDKRRLSCTCPHCSGEFLLEIASKKVDSGLKQQAGFTNNVCPLCSKKLAEVPIDRGSELARKVSRGWTQRLKAYREFYSLVVDNRLTIRFVAKTE